MTADEEQFAIHVLWHLASLRADMLQMQSMILGWAHSRDEQPKPETTERWKAEHMKARDLLFQQALQKTGLAAAEYKTTDGNETNS